MSKTKKAQRASQHIMQAMEHGMNDLVRNGFSPNESATIVCNAAIARMCVLVLPANEYKANELFKSVLELFRDATKPSQPTAPAAEPEKPVRPVIEPDPPPARAAHTVSNDSPEMMISTLPIQEDRPKPRTPADILYPKR